MCGIIGCVSDPADTQSVLLSGLKNLEYRGYDSAGIALAEPNRRPRVIKREGELANLVAAIEETDAERDTAATTGIGHTRWSTHGPPSDRNAHPHTDDRTTVAVVHNGIIENYQSIRDELLADGVAFTSETDSEVVPHLIRRELDAGKEPQTAFVNAIDRLDGSYAIAAVIAGSEAIYAARNDSPLVLGIGEDATYLASDVPAFLEYTRDVIYLENGEFARLEPDDWTVFDESSRSIRKDIKRTDWDPEQTAKSGYGHFMLKEIHEQPTALRQCLSGRIDELDGQVTVEELAGVETPDRVQFVACGTSYHAALYGVELFHEEGIPATAFLASEYASSPPPVPEDGVVIGVTQSGETADTLSALREAKARGAETIALTNTVGSSAARECDHTMYIRAGPEIGVAATKTFSSQLLSLNLLVESLTPGMADRSLLEALRGLPDQLQAVLDTSRVEPIVDSYMDAESYFFIGRGTAFPVALEGALKFKEITYEHAEGFAAGELKHGPLALVTERTPVFAVVLGEDDRATKTLGNVKEVEARSAPVIAVTDGQTSVERYAEATLSIPETHPRTTPLLANVQLQLVSYHVADRLGRSIDKPRNLAKSVTVE